MRNGRELSCYTSCREYFRGQTSSNKREWFNDECEKAVEERNQAHRSYLSRPTRSRQLEYEELQRKADKTCRQKERGEHKECLMDIEEDIRRSELRKAHKGINNPKTGFKPHTNLYKD
jgi:hypothetical protein